MKEYDLDHEKTFISAFQAGEEKVFRYVFEKFYSSLCVYCLRLIREEWVAADLVQEAFVKLWENRQNFSSLLTIRSYLYTIVRNSGINYLRYMKMKAEKLYIADLIVELRLWRESSEENERLYQELLTMGGMELQQKEVALFVPETAWKMLSEKVSGKRKHRAGSNILKYAAVACAVSGIAFSVFYISGNKTPETVEAVAVAQVPAIAHGSSKAVLILEDGSSVKLDRQSTFQTADATVRNTEHTGVISYKKTEKTEKKEVKMNRLIVPRGGEYRVELADGTLVYLNAESELQYPVTFIGESREVTLRGEAYFKVTKNNEKPFIVKSDGLSVQVWGTEFNLNTLNQEGYYAATLVEGSVEVKVPGRHSVFLEPSQQARVDCATSDITCLKVNTLPYTAWKDGKFVFNHEDMQHITMRLEKWYDVEFTYSEETLKNLKVFGVISRYEDITKVLKLLSATRLVSFRYVNHKIMVVPYQRF